MIQTVIHVARSDKSRISRPEQLHDIKCYEFWRSPTSMIWYIGAGAGGRLWTGAPPPQLLVPDFNVTTTQNTII